MDWEATYSDKTVYSSQNYSWEEIPDIGFIKLDITLPTGGKMVSSGWDFYALEEIENGLKVSFWKDTVANDINGNPIEEPYLNKGGNRHFYNDGTADNIEYKDAEEIYKDIPVSLIKKGVWVSDDLARELKVL